jgi:hypothetical protein
MYINLKQNKQVNELKHLNTQGHQQLCDRLIMLLWENLIIYNSSKQKQILGKKSPPELINPKPIFK